MKPRQKRFVFAGVVAIALLMVVALVKTALDNNASLYFTPTQVYNKEAPQGRSFRIGGLVEEGSVKREKDGLTVNFVITDKHKSIPAIFRGILPDLFKEGKGVVAQGKIEADGILHADEVLAKHDENYMPPEAVDALKKGETSNSMAASPANK